MRGASPLPLLLFPALPLGACGGAPAGATDGQVCVSALERNIDEFRDKAKKWGVTPVQADRWSGSHKLLVARMKDTRADCECSSEACELARVALGEFERAETALDIYASRTKLAFKLDERPTFEQRMDNRRLDIRELAHDIGTDSCAVEIDDHARKLQRHADYMSVFNELSARMSSREGLEIPLDEMDARYALCEGSCEEEVQFVSLSGELDAIVGLLVIAEDEAQVPETAVHLRPPITPVRLLGHLWKVQIAGEREGSGSLAMQADLAPENVG